MVTFNNHGEFANSLDVPVLVIARHKLAVGACAVVGIQHTAHAVVSERVAVAAAVRRLAHRLDVTSSGFAWSPSHCDAGNDSKRVRKTPHWRFQ